MCNLLKVKRLKVDTLSYKTISANADVESEKTLIRTALSYDFNIPSYETMIKEMRDWVLAHKELYPLIFENTNLEVEKIK